MEKGSGLNPKVVRAVVIDGACLWEARKLQHTLAKLRQDRDVIILNRMDLPQPAAQNTPVAALFIICRELDIAPNQCLVVDHDHRRAGLAAMLGFQSAVILSQGGHTRKLLSAGLLAAEDIEAMGIAQIDCLSQIKAMLSAPRRAID